MTSLKSSQMSFFFLSGAKENLRDYSGRLALQYLNIKEPECPEEDCELREFLTLTNYLMNNKLSFIHFLSFLTSAVIHCVFLFFKKKFFLLSCISQCLAIP